MEARNGGDCLNPVPPGRLRSPQGHAGVRSEITSRTDALRSLRALHLPAGAARKGRACRTPGRTYRHPGVENPSGRWSVNGRIAATTPWVGRARRTGPATQGARTGDPGSAHRRPRERAPATRGRKRAPAPRGPAPAPRGPAPAPRGPAPATRGPAPATRGPAPATRGPAPATQGARAGDPGSARRRPRERAPATRGRKRAPASRYPRWRHA